MSKHAGPPAPHDNALEVFADLVLGAHLMGPHELPDHVATHAARLGFGDAVLYLADLEGRVLLPFLPGGQPDIDHRHTALGIDSTLAGRVFQQLEPLGQADGEGHVRTWVPVLRGVERLGVLAVNLEVSSDTDETEHRRMLALFAAEVAELVITRQSFGDTITRLRRTSPMGLAAEIQWDLLPPLAFANRDVSVAGALEPAYEVAGDSVDYAVDRETAWLAIFDGMGHGLDSARLASVLIAAYRNARRAGQSLTAAWERIDSVVTDVTDGEGFATGLIAELDSRTGALTWLNAGHPSPLLIRGNRAVKELRMEPELPFGMGALREPPAATGGDRVGHVQLQPGDYLLLYTDGMVESRSPAGKQFGVDRLTELLVKSIVGGMPASETLRRAVRALMDHQSANLSDDATLLLTQWRPPHDLRLLGVPG